MIEAISDKIVASLSSPPGAYFPASQDFNKVNILFRDSFDIRLFKQVSTLVGSKLCDGKMSLSF